MTIRPQTLVSVLTLGVLMTTCGAGSAGGVGAPSDLLISAPSDEFNVYWYQGKAEVNRYALSQARYGELRNGDAIMVLVTEDFLTNDQVKYEGGSEGPKTSVLKLNWLERFNTGIYDYSLMTSVFSPVDGSAALKSTCSVQDWCGQAFIQLNMRENGYHFELRSYFEKEGDKDGVIGKLWLEDAIWNQIRLDPKKLPIGAVQMLPSSSYLRLMHKPVIGVQVNSKLIAGPDTTLYRMEFPEYERTMEIRFGTVAPHTIFGWSETRPDGFGVNVRTLTTTAVLTHQVMEPYWGMNANGDDAERERLGLERMPVR